MALLLAAPLRAADSKDEPAAKESAAEKSSLELKPRLIRLSKDHPIWIDPQRKLVVVDGEIAMREGALEMFACPKGTKEHESVIAVQSTGQLMHAGLLAVGATAGHPVRFDPEYTPATGSVIEVWVLWQDDQGNHRVRAQDWIKNVKTDQPMEHPWVFGGSGFWTDETTGEKHYHADAGDLICVSNFSTAMLDLPIESSQANDALLYAAFTERIPPRGTKVRLVLSPRKAEPTTSRPAAEKPPASSEAAQPASATSEAELPKDRQPEKGQ
jgi:hypothetical protein